MSHAFSPGSRYANAVLRTYVGPDGREIRYVEARILPAPERHQPLTLHRIEQAEPVHLLAARYYGDAEQYWRICDANRVSWPPATTARPGATLLIPVPLEVGDRGDT